jgi:hypothetical protein
MGLAAPFWFDVAKRLAQIRQGLRSRASDEVRMSVCQEEMLTAAIKSAKKIVRQVVNDITRENRSN